MTPEIELLRAKLAGANNTELRTLFERTIAQMPPAPTTCSENIPLSDPRAFEVPVRRGYFARELQPPPQLAAFLSGADAGELVKANQLERIERLVIDWLNRHHPPPPELGYYLDFSEAIVGLGQPAPLELWITWRTNCSADDYPISREG